MFRTRRIIYHGTSRPRERPKDGQRLRKARSNDRWAADLATVASVERPAMSGTNASDASNSICLSWILSPELRIREKSGLPHVRVAEFTGETLRVAVTEIVRGEILIHFL